MTPIYEQIVEQIKALIRQGELKENDILPSVRTLAKELKISALTVKKAYDYLEEALPLLFTERAAMLRLLIPSFCSKNRKRNWKPIWKRQY